MLITSIPQYIQGVTNAKVDLIQLMQPLCLLFLVMPILRAVVNSILVSEDSGTTDTITVDLNKW